MFDYIENVKRSFLISWSRKSKAKVHRNRNQTTQWLSIADSSMSTSKQTVLQCSKHILFMICVSVFGCVLVRVSSGIVGVASSTLVPYQFALARSPRCNYEGKTESALCVIICRSLLQKWTSLPKGRRENKMHLCRPTVPYLIFIHQFITRMCMAILLGNTSEALPAPVTEEPNKTMLRWKKEECLRIMVGGSEPIGGHSKCMRPSTEKARSCLAEVRIRRSQRRPST